MKTQAKTNLTGPSDKRQDLKGRLVSTLPLCYQVQYKSHSQAEWFSGTVTDLSPESETEPFLIKFDDGEEERGRIGQSVFRPKQEVDRPFKWLADTSRASLRQGATDHTSQELPGKLQTVEPPKDCGSEPSQPPPVKRYVP